MAEMLSSTASDATPRVFLGRAKAAGDDGRGLVDARALNEGFCSPAGLHRRPWLERLRRALDSGSFVLHFQPIVALSDRRTSHHEALLRLADEPDGRLVAPGRFLPAAERYGLVREIDRMVIDEVAARLAAAGDERVRIAVNVSALSVTDPTMLAYIERRLRWHGVEASQLVVEITETAAISDMESARIFCAGVLELGCDLALDDFGAGFGSFQYLKHLPFSYLKIDGDFIRRLPVSRTDQLVVRAIAGVVRGMGALTIAEFVGDETTIEMLRSYGVDYAQGFAVGRPAPTLAVMV
jgi:EAL domain-containing protein (putative c-di-GMP-specific phosphodiesterase class I)